MVRSPAADREAEVVDVGGLFIGVICPGNTVVSYTGGQHLSRDPFDFGFLVAVE